MADTPINSHSRRSVVAPDLDTLPEHALLTRAQVVQLSGFALPTFKLWARQGKGPKLVRVEGHPRYPAGDFRRWVSGQQVA